MAAKHALIIGASRGLGLGLTAEFAARGWQVTATVRDASRPGGPGDIAGVSVETLDIDDHEAVERFVGRLGDRQFDLIFLNAGVAGPRGRTVAELPPDEVARVFQTNAVSPVRVAERLLDRLAPRAAVLGFMTSILGSIAGNDSGGFTVYRASKAALNSLTRSLTATLGDRDVTVLSFHPGWVRTDMGGENAPIDVATSVRGIADQILRRAGSRAHGFIDYQGQTLPW